MQSGKSLGFPMLQGDTICTKTKHTFFNLSEHVHISSVSVTNRQLYVPYIRLIFGSFFFSYRHISYVFFSERHCWLSLFFCRYFINANYAEIIM